jgi:beta-xylosidase
MFARADVVAIFTDADEERFPSNRIHSSRDLDQLTVPSEILERAVSWSFRGNEPATA